MKPQNSYYSNYLLSVHFNHQYRIDDVFELIEKCENFLNELGDMARQSAIKLHATYSLVSGKTGIHAHFALNWLPTIKTLVTSYKGQFPAIKRKCIAKMMREHGFYVDNEREAIKSITSRKDYVTDYVVFQTKDGQSTIYTSFFVYDILERVHSKGISRPYCLSMFSVLSERVQKVVRNNGCFSLLMILSIILLMILSFIAMLF